MDADRFRAWRDEHRYTSISGETIDFGPCAFMEAYDPGTVFSSSMWRALRLRHQPTLRCGTWRGWPRRCCLIALEVGSEESALAAANQALSSSSRSSRRRAPLDFCARLAFARTRGRCVAR